jgi:hypothetical protein
LAKKGKEEREQEREGWRDGGRAGGREGGMEGKTHRPRPLASVTSAKVCSPIRKPATVIESWEKKPTTVPDP